MKRDETLLGAAIEALKSDEPGSAQVSASARRVADRLGIDGFETHSKAIDSCDDVQPMLSAYRARILSESQSLIVAAHLQECSACLRKFKSGPVGNVLDWSAPRAARAVTWQPQAFGWALAACLALGVSLLFVYRAYWQVPPGVQARVQSIDGFAYGLTDAGALALRAGDELKAGERLRTAGGSHAVLRLSDGSTVEVNERSVLGVAARGHNMTVSLDGGAVIVQAAKRTSGHLYVKTPDCRVAVTGTVFSVDSGMKGSRVAVLQGAVHVAHSGIDSLLQAGDQIATSENLNPEPLNEQISWSHDREKYLPLLAQFATLRQRIGEISFPQPRYASDLLDRVPADTVLYISIPNLGDFLTQANTIFKDQLSRSAELRQWWGHDGDRKTADLDALVARLHDISQYLGDEVVIVGTRQEGSRQGKESGFAVMADLQKSGLADLLKQQFSASESNKGLIVLDEQSLASVPAAQSGAYALVRQHEVIFSPSLATLTVLNAQLNAGASGFASGQFGQQIAAAYQRGAGIVLAADLHQMISEGPNGRGVRKNVKAMESSGMNGVQYLIAEHREINGVPQNHLNLQFSGTRQRVASWLGTPAPMGSLDFVSANAAFATAVLSKDPKEIADDMMAMAESDNNGHTKNWDEAEAKLQISIRDDLAASLGGEFLVALDGPVLPTPSWKAIIEVRDSARLEKTLEQLTQAIREQEHDKDSHEIVIEPSQVGAQTFYSLRDLKTGAVVAQYSFADGYMILAPSHALILDALQIHANGSSLSRSESFKALLPKDENENYSAIAYQNLGPVLTPLLSQLSGKAAEAIRELAADSKPTAICAWGKDSRIEAASDSRLFGFDFLTLGSLLNSRNKLNQQSVRE